MNVGMIAKLFGIDPAQMVAEANKVMATFVDTMSHFNRRLDAQDVNAAELRADMAKARETLAAMSVALDTAIAELAAARDAASPRVGARNRG